jgi:nucleotide-binding universal stress UspA family protein
MAQNNERDGFIVVGVDGSESSLDALRWAADQAKMTRRTLKVVSTWEWPTTFAWAPAWPQGLDLDLQAKEALAGVVTKILGAEPEIKVEQFACEGHPAPILLDFADKADLLVVGCRGHGAFAGMLLGSVSEHCATHAPCPVVVVRHSPDNN